MPCSYFRRRFLNNDEDGGLAAVRAAVQEVVYSKDTVMFEATLEISDCNRRVELDFTAYGEEGLENIRLKTRRLKTVVNSFVAQVLLQCDEVDAYHG